MLALLLLWAESHISHSMYLLCVESVTWSKLHNCVSFGQAYVLAVRRVALQILLSMALSKDSSDIEVSIRQLMGVILVRKVTILEGIPLKLNKRGGHASEQLTSM